jgi:hypothetical protein
VAEYVKAETSVSACVPQSPGRRSSNRQNAKYERARIERDLLTPLVGCPADEFDGLDPFLLAFGGKEIYVVIVCFSIFLGFVFRTVQKFVLGLALNRFELSWSHPRLPERSPGSAGNA